MTLPKSLNPSYLLGKEAPGDITVQQLCESFKATDAWAVLNAAAKGHARINVKFRESGNNVPPDMTLKDMRRLVAAGKVVISIDDGLGGELVS